MEKLQLQATKRELTDSPAKVRKTGNVPAELYGHNTANIHLNILENEFERVFRKAGESTIIELLTEDGQKHSVLIHDVQRHYLTGATLHVDFYQVNLTEKLKADVALEFIGESKAVKEQGGTLVKVLDTIEIECLPTDLPHNLPVDISALKTFEDVITVSQVVLPSGVVLVTPGDELVIKVQPPREVEAELSAPVVEDVAAVGSVEKEKKEEEPAA